MATSPAVNVELPEIVQYVATGLFAIAILHTFLVKKFAAIAHRAQSVSQISVTPSNMASTATPVAAIAVPLAAPHISDEPLITTTSKLLNELKQAYTLILHEKEEQIIYLKEEIADLKTLVRVLESDNARLRKTPAGNA